VGQSDGHAFARAVLGLFDDLPVIAQCTVFVYQEGRMRTLSVADYRGGAYLRSVADEYAQRFYSLDSIGSILALPQTALPVLHHQSSSEIGHATYRYVCYRRPSVTERLALLSPQRDNAWLSVNLYRRDLGCGGNRGFEPSEIARVQETVPLIMQAVTLHWTLCSVARPVVADAFSIDERLARLCPQLSMRESQTLHEMLQGRSTLEIAKKLGVQQSSVISYQKRAYQRLGISGQRQLLALIANI
jgi:DNA-binding CsgD family transcriptional regulator